MKWVGIVAWVLVAVLLAGAGGLGFLLKQQSGNVASLSDALVQAGTAAGLEGLAADSLKDPAKRQEVAQQIEAAIQATRMELATTKDSLAAAQTEASGAKAEVTTLTASVADEKAKAESAAKDAAAKAEALAAAKAAAEKSAQELQDAQAAAEKQRVELEASLEAVKAQATEETGRLQAELDSLRQQSATAAAGSAEGEAGVPVEEAEGAEVALAAPPEDEGAERVVGQSEMFSVVRYDRETQTMFFNLQDGQTLTYRDVPRGTYEQLIAASDGMDIYYRFKIQGAFKSVPPDSVVVRKYWKNSRYRPKLVDVRGTVLEDETVPAVEEPAAGEAPPAEAPVAPESAAPAAP